MEGACEKDPVERMGEDREKGVEEAASTIVFNYSGLIVLILHIVEDWSIKQPIDRKEKLYDSENVKHFVHRSANLLLKYSSFEVFFLTKYFEIRTPPLSRSVMLGIMMKG